jgi:hypothetical protein
MKKFNVTINAYDHYAKFQVSSEDNPISLEQAIVDKLGENVIVWEYTGDMYDSRKYRITYEEVINDAKPAYPGPVSTEEVSGIKMGAGAS